MNQKIKLDEISETLNVPKFFLAKVMNRLVKEGIISSLKGHAGGFCINESTLDTRLIRLAEITGELHEYHNCVLSFRACHTKNPCPLHHKIEPLKVHWKNLLEHTSIRDLVNGDDPGFINSISADACIL